MKKGVVPFQYEEEKSSTGMTALGGLPTYLDLAQVVGSRASVERHMKFREGGQGRSDSQMVTSLVLLNRFDLAHYRSGWWGCRGRSFGCVYEKGANTVAGT